MKYEAWISDKATLGMKGNRFVEVEAKGYREAHRLATKECGEGEFVRGVNETEEEEAYDPMQHGVGQYDEVDDRRFNPEAYGLER